MAHPLIADALTYVSGEATWFDLYKAFECIKASGLATPLPRQELFTRTANAIYRHRKGGFAPPDDPMSLTEGRCFIQKWIDASIENALTTAAP